MLVRRIVFTGTPTQGPFVIGSNTIEARIDTGDVAGVPNDFPVNATQQAIDNRLAHLHINHSPLVTIGDNQLGAPAQIVARWHTISRPGIVGNPLAVVLLTIVFSGQIPNPLGSLAIAVNLGVEGATGYSLI